MVSEIEPATVGDEGAAIKLPQKLDTAAAGALHAELTTRTGSDVTLDGSGVELLGGRCLDLLISARAHWTAEGKSLAVSKPSDAMCRDLATFGISVDALATGDTR